MSATIKLYAGAGKSEIWYPDDIFPFRDGPDLWTGIHDVPCVRAVLLDCGQKVLILSLEVVILDGEQDKQIRTAASELTGIPEEQIWVINTHTVSTPHFMVREHNTPEENALAQRMRTHIMQAVEEAVVQAKESLQPGRIGFGQGTCRANVSSVIETRDGWWLGSGEENPADHCAAVVRIDDADGKTIAILYNYHCELSVMDGSVMSDGGRHVTADLAGVASRFLEEEYNDRVVALFLPGISTDQAPAYKAVRTVRGRNGSYRSVDIKEQGWTLLELEGERLGEQVLLAAERAQCKEVDHPIVLGHRTLWFAAQKLRGLPNPRKGPVRQWPFQPDGERTRSIELMVLGDVAFLGVGGLGMETARKIQQASPFPHTVLLSGLTGGAGRLPTDGQKCMVEEEMYQKVTVQARNSEFAAGSAEKMLDESLNFLEDMYRKS